jgi:hypothetical protein
MKQINAAHSRAQTTIAGLSPRCLTSKWCELEWDAALTLEVKGSDHRLLPVQIQDGKLPPVLDAKARVVLMNLSADAARERLLQAIDGPNGPPKEKPPLPVTIITTAAVPANPIVAPPRPPGKLPDVWNIPHECNRNFTGRDELLER